MTNNILKTYQNLETGDDVLTMCEKFDRELVIIIGILLADLSVVGTASIRVNVLLNGSDGLNINLIVVINELFENSPIMRYSPNGSNTSEPPGGNKYRFLTEGVNNPPSLDLYSVNYK